MNSYSKLTDKKDKLDDWDKAKFQLSFKYVKNNPLILDIGCSKCQFFDFLNKNKIKFTGYGFDTDKEALSKSRYTTFSSLSDITKKFDVITMWEIIEHIPLEMFLDYLDYIKKIIKKEGVLLISTPNIMNIFYPFWSEPTHIRPYCLDSLTKILKSQGFEIIEKKKKHRLINPIKLIFCKLMNLDSYSKLFVVAKLPS